MKLLHVVSGAWKNIGGPAEVIPQLCLALSNLGCTVTMVTVSGDLSESMLDASRKGVRLVDFPERWRTPIRFTPGLSGFLRENGRSYDVIHNHGHWLHPNWAAAQFSRKYSVPLVTTPHGTLVPGMLRQSRAKKMAAWYAFDRWLIKRASVIHCLSGVEKSRTAQWLPKSDCHKLTVIPNGVSLPMVEREAIQAAWLGFDPTKKKLLYMARVHRIKGILDLLAAWSEVSPVGWELIVIGPVEEDVKELVAKYGTHESITILGPIYGKKRFGYLLAADAFVLPSYAEGLPTSLLEAGAAGKAILATRECNFDDLETHECAIVINAGQGEIVGALRRLVAMSTSELTALGERARTLVETQYSWDSIAKEWLGIYQKLVGDEHRRERL